MIDALRPTAAIGWNEAFDGSILSAHDARGLGALDAGRRRLRKAVTAIADLVLVRRFAQVRAVGRDTRDALQPARDHRWHAGRRVGGMRVVAVGAGHVPRHRQRVLARVVQPGPDVDRVARILAAVRELVRDVLLRHAAGVTDRAVVHLDALREQPRSVPGRMRAMAIEARIRAHGRRGAFRPRIRATAVPGGARRSRATNRSIARAGGNSRHSAPSAFAMRRNIGRRSSCGSWQVVHCSCSVASRRTFAGSVVGIDEFAASHREFGVVDERDRVVVAQVRAEHALARHRPEVEFLAGRRPRAGCRARGCRRDTTGTAANCRSAGWAWPASVLLV